MTPAEFKKAWPGGLCAASRQTADQLQISEEDREFLVSAGLPNYTADECSFERLEEGDVPPLDEAEDCDGFGPEFHRYRIIGAGGYGEPMCVDEEGEGAVFVLDLETGEMDYVNSSVRTLARSLLTFEQDRDADEPDAERCRNAIRSFDARAVAEGSYWAKRLDAYAEDDARPPLDLSDDGYLEIEHPLLGTLAGGGDEWEGETDRLRKFSACGWNQRHVGEHCSPAYDDAGNRVRPPAGENFAPKARPPKREPKSIRFIIECEEATPPTQAQELTIEYLFKNEDRLLRMIAAAVRKRVAEPGYWGWMQESLGEDFPKLAKLLETPAGWLSLIEFREIRVSNKTRDGKIVVGCDCHCAWDDEHGLGLQFVDDRVIQIGYGTVGWNIYDS